MKEMTARLAEDEELAAAHRRAHEAYLADREALGHVPEIAGISAGGMPHRVKCLHVLVAHALAAGPGVNPVGDEALELVAEPLAPRPLHLLTPLTRWRAGRGRRPGAPAGSSRPAVSVGGGTMCR